MTENNDNSPFIIALAALLYLIVLNHLFLDSAIITVVSALAALYPFYMLFKNMGASPEVGEIPSVESAVGVVKENEELREIVAGIGTSVDQLWDKSSKLSIGTDAQVFSLEETTVSIQGISESIRKTVEMIERLSPSADRASRSVSGLIASIGDISSHNRDVLKALEKAIKDIKEMSSSVMIIRENFDNLSQSSANSSRRIREIHTFAKNIEGSALESHKLSEDVAKEAGHGVDSVRRTIESMENIKRIVTESSSVIKSLGDRSGEISNIVKLIDSLTTRINLLALNASIIASQAGEHGKPFAVVASEMEKLASQSSSSTVEISQLTEAIQDMVQSTVQATEVGMWGVEEGVSLANKAGDILQNIQERSGASVDMTKNILSATGKQARMADDILAAIAEESKNLGLAGKSISEHVQLNSLVDESANLMISLTEEVKKAIEKQHMSSKDISEVIDEVITMVSDLAGLTRQQNDDSEQIKQATEIINFISSENINAIKDMASSVEVMKKDMDEASKSLLKESQGVIDHGLKG